MCSIDEINDTKKSKITTYKYTKKNSYRKNK